MSFPQRAGLFPRPYSPPRINQSPHAGSSLEDPLNSIVIAGGDQSTTAVPPHHHQKSLAFSFYPSVRSGGTSTRKVLSSARAFAHRMMAGRIAGTGTSGGTGPAGLPQDVTSSQSQSFVDASLRRSDDSTRVRDVARAYAVAQRGGGAAVGGGPSSSRAPLLSVGSGGGSGNRTTDAPAMGSRILSGGRAGGATSSSLIQEVEDSLALSVTSLFENALSEGVGAAGEAVATVDTSLAVSGSPEKVLRRDAATSTTHARSGPAVSRVLRVNKNVTLGVVGGGGQQKRVLPSCLFNRVAHAQENRRADVPAISSRLNKENHHGQLVLRPEDASQPRDDSSTSPSPTRNITQPQEGRHFAPVDETPYDDDGSPLVVSSKPVSLTPEKRTPAAVLLQQRTKFSRQGPQHNPAKNPPKLMQYKVAASSSSRRPSRGQSSERGGAQVKIPARGRANTGRSAQFSSTKKAGLPGSGRDDRRVIMSAREYVTLQHQLTNNSARRSRRGSADEDHLPTDFSYDEDGVSAGTSVGTSSIAGGARLGGDDEGTAAVSGSAGGRRCAPAPAVASYHIRGEVGGPRGVNHAGPRGDVVSGEKAGNYYPARRTSATREYRSLSREGRGASLPRRRSSVATDRPASRNPSPGGRQLLSRSALLGDVGRGAGTTTWFSHGYGPQGYKVAGGNLFATSSIPASRRGSAGVAGGWHTRVKVGGNSANTAVSNVRVDMGASRGVGNKR